MASRERRREERAIKGREGLTLEPLAAPSPATGDRPTAGARRRTHGFLPPRLARPAWRGPPLQSVSGGARTVRDGARLSGDEPEAGAGRWGEGAAGAVGPAWPPGARSNPPASLDSHFGPNFAGEDRDCWMHLGIVNFFKFMRSASHGRPRGRGGGMPRCRMWLGSAPLGCVSVRHCQKAMHEFLCTYFYAICAHR